MIRLDLHFELDYRIDAPHGDFVFNIQPAHTAAQRVLQEHVVLTPDVPWRSETIASTRNRLLRVRAPQGDFHLTYSASVSIEHRFGDPAFIGECPIDELPVELLTYLAPSRYCESDRLIPWAEAEFGHVPPGYARAAAIAAWVQRHIAYAPYGSTTQTTALDTLTDRVGVCRDQAHVMIALCRALSMPARYVTGTDYGADPTKAPDFHAYVEVYLGRRWYTFDASGNGIPMGFVRIGTGRDAADVPFATLFGQIQAPFAPLVRATACSGPGLQLPVRSDRALSSDGDSAGCLLAPIAA
ncbi:transglutaminase family protein [Roseateles sp.]|uniref:transglutaminase-like domain-containing protein n=1 Tax=Roseateles sp. TaxID=1971397 RepID=UPI002F3FDAFB